MRKPYLPDPPTTLAYKVKLAAFVVAVGTALAGMVTYTMNRSSIPRPTNPTDIFTLPNGAEVWRYSASSYYVAHNGVALVGPQVSAIGCNATHTWGRLGTPNDNSSLVFAIELKSDTTRTFTDAKSLRNFVGHGPFDGSWTLQVGVLFKDRR